MKKLAVTPSTVFGSTYTSKAAFYKVNFIKENTDSDRQTRAVFNETQLQERISNFGRVAQIKKMSLISLTTGYKDDISCYGFDFRFISIINASVSVINLFLSATKYRIPVQNFNRKYIYEL